MVLPSHLKCIMSIACAINTPRSTYGTLNLSTAFFGDCCCISRNLGIIRSIANPAALRLWCTPPTPLSISIIVAPDLTLKITNALLQGFIFLFDFFQLRLVLCNFLIAWGANDTRATVISLIRIAGRGLRGDGVAMWDVARWQTATGDARGTAVAAGGRGMHRTGRGFGMGDGRVCGA